MDWVERLNAAIGYIEAGLDGEIDIVEAARRANCSAFHFMRMFEVVAEVPVWEYVRRRRLSKAALDIAAGGEKVIDVALRYGYESPEAFARAFRRLFGMSPSEARDPGARLEAYMPITVAVVLKGDSVMKYRIVEKGPMRLVGARMRTNNKDGVNMREIPAFWQRCEADGTCAKLSKIAGPMGFFGVCYDADCATGDFSYLIGVEKPAIEGLSKGLDEVELPKSTWAVFECVGPMPKAIQDTWKAAFNEWFPTSGYEHAGTPDMEVYPPSKEGYETCDASSPNYYSEVWIPLKKK
jgi:AraC family transcriptional regulator